MPYFTLNLYGWREKKEILELLEHLGWGYVSRLIDIEYWGALNTQVIKLLLMKNVGLEVYVELLHTNGYVKIDYYRKKQQQQGKN